MSAAVLLAVALAALVALVGVVVRDHRVHYGPVIVGNARWRHEAPKREAWATHREAVDTLTEEDREWLTERGWKPPRDRWEWERLQLLALRYADHRTTSKRRPHTRSSNRVLCGGGTLATPKVGAEPRIPQR